MALAFTPRPSLVPLPLLQPLPLPSGSVCPRADFVNIRKAAREIMQKEDDLNEIVQLVGKVRALGAGRPAAPG